jgi:hypothetical protein
LPFPELGGVEGTEPSMLRRFDRRVATPGEHPSSGCIARVSVARERRRSKCRDDRGPKPKKRFVAFSLATFLTQD